MRLLFGFLLLTLLGNAVLTFAPDPLHAAPYVVSPSGASGSGSISDRVKVWIYFVDHAEADPAGLQTMIDRVEIDARARERRQRRSTGYGPDIHDVPLHEPYVNALHALGCDVRRESRYFNAVSAWVSPQTLDAVAALPFVRRIEPVRFGTRPVSPGPAEIGAGEALPTDRRDITVQGAPGSLAVDYGFTLSQNRQINTLPLHAAGYHGEGIRIAVLDTGFFREHTAFANLNVVSEWDFINDDPVTSDEIVPGSLDVPGQMWHGTATLGALASNWPGHVMGTAWAAEYLLAKTERLLDEVRVEEDDYVAALEWADQLGADVVSSSLGYYYWYTYEDMDGKTALCTQAVDIAASHGVVVATAAGNEGELPWPGIIAPGDAAGAITVGATDTLGVITPSSSRGPTYDGRIKPDVVARGRFVITVNWQNPNGLYAFGGTSGATPLVAGACALIVQKDPTWSAAQVRDALRATASRADAPDNAYGWGMIDAAAASDYRTAITVALEIRAGSCESPFQPKSRGLLPTLLLGTDKLDVTEIDAATLRLGGAAAVRATVADLDGSGDGDVCIGQSPDGRDDLLVLFRASDIAAELGSTNRDDTVPLALTGALNDGTVLEGVALVRIVGEQNHLAQAARAQDAVLTLRAHPNPFFRPSTRIFYHVPAAAPVQLSVFDVSGRCVSTLVDAYQQAGSHQVTWNASAQASGVYFYKLVVGSFEERRRLVLIK